MHWERIGYKQRPRFRKHALSIEVYHVCYH